LENIYVRDDFRNINASLMFPEPGKTSSATRGQVQPITLEYACGDKTFYSWNVDSKTLNFEGDFSQENKEEVGELYSHGRFAPSLTDATALLGGSSGAWGIKDALTLVKSKVGGKFKKLALVILGGGTGFSAGYGLATIHTPTCSSGEVLDFIGDSLMNPY
jgi:hypothetical protein